MLSDTSQHADLNAALQPYYSEMCSDTFPVSPYWWGKGGAVGGSEVGWGWEEEEGWHVMRTPLI